MVGLVWGEASLSVTYYFMNPLIPDPAGFELLPDAVKATEAIMAGLDTVSILETNQASASTLVPVAEEPCRFRPSSRWGINE